MLSGGIIDNLKWKREEHDALIPFMNWKHACGNILFPLHIGSLESNSLD